MFRSVGEATSKPMNSASWWSKQKKRHGAARQALPLDTALQSVRPELAGDTKPSVGQSGGESQPCHRLLTLGKSFSPLVGLHLYNREQFISIQQAAFAGNGLESSASHFGGFRFLPHTGTTAQPGKPTPSISPGFIKLQPHNLTQGRPWP